MVSIISGKNSFYVDFKDLNDETLWMEGWQELPFNRLDKIEENKMKVNVNNYFQSSCAHPSEDSGLLIPTKESIIRPWFFDT